VEILHECEMSWCTRCDCLYLWEWTVWTEL